MDKKGRFVTDKHGTDCELKLIYTIDGRKTQIKKAEKDCVSNL